MGYNGNLNSRASEVITVQGDLRRGDSSGNPERLAIGSANQLLQSDGTTESWATVTDLAPPTTTKGDLSGFSTVSARIPVGTNNYTILADSAQALGLKYGVSSTSILSASGDILYASGANTLAKLAKASDGDTLQLASGVPAWVTVSSGGASTTYTDEKLSSDFTTDVCVSGGDPVDVTGLAITLGGSGKFIAQANGGVYTSGGAGTAPVWDIVHDGTIIRRMGTSTSASGRSMAYTNGAGGTCDSTIVKLQVNSPVGITTVRGTGDYLTGLWVMEIY